MARSPKALLIDYEYCLGCSECETACLTVHGYEPYQAGIKVVKFGPWRTRDGSWQYDFIPMPTDWCDLCEERVAQGKERPLCVRRCQYGVISYGDVDELAESLKAKRKMILVTPRNAAASSGIPTR